MTEPEGREHHDHGFGAASDRTPLQVRIDQVVYGGYGLARVNEPNGHAVARFVPFSLPGELVEAVETGNANELKVLRVVNPSRERVLPECPHFGACGGCHLQMASYEEQLRIKGDVLKESLRRAGMVGPLPGIVTHSAEPRGYRNRIRLHVAHESGTLRLGYRERNSRHVLPITTCPIAAPLLWSTAERLLSSAAGDSNVQRWLKSATEIELFCDDAMKRAQVMFLCEKDPGLPAESFKKAIDTLHAEVHGLAGAGAASVHPRTGQIRREIAAWGDAGLNYAVAGERYWIARGGFFQVNRFLLPTMVRLVCGERAGESAWDLFAGVGLFARVLAQRFKRVTAVEANATAARELHSAMQRAGPTHVGVQATTLEFLRRAAIERDRPELIVLDPPRAGVGPGVCELLTKIAPAEIVYVSCDPVTLARDLATLQAKYAIESLHLVDLFPQTYHQEAVVAIRRRS